MTFNTNIVIVLFKSLLVCQNTATYTNTKINLLQHVQIISLVVIGVILWVPVHFGVGGTVSPLFTSCHSCGTTRRLQRSQDSVARLVEEERVRKGAREGKWRRQGRGDRCGTPLFSPK